MRKDQSPNAKSQKLNINELYINEQTCPVLIQKCK